MIRSQAITATVVHLAELAGRRDAERAHKVRHVEPVGAAGARTLLAGKPDLLLGDAGELVEVGELAGPGRWDGRAGHAGIVA